MWRRKGGLACTFIALLGCSRGDPTAHVEKPDSTTPLEPEERLSSAALFPFDFALPDVDGKTITLADHRGKVTIVDFWGTWCPPCREEVPLFVELKKRYGKQGLEIVGITYENGGGDVKQTIKDFIQENGVSYICVIGDDKTRDQIPDFEGYPTTLFIDRAGKVRLKLTGGRKLAVLESFVKELLSNKSPGQD